MWKTGIASLWFALINETHDKCQMLNVEKNLNEDTRPTKHLGEIAEKRHKFNKVDTFQSTIKEANYSFGNWES